MKLTFIIAVLSFVFTGKLVAVSFVDPQYVLVEKWEGWGTSLAWYSDVLGGIFEAVQNEITTALFSPEKLNLNIVRYTIGGTTPDDEYNCGPFRQGAAAESFWDAVDSPYAWLRDPRARKVLQAAKRLGADTFEAISFSPPMWLTKSGCSNGNPEGAPLRDNLDPAHVNAFADYLTEVVKYYHENYGISFTSLSPFHMPSHEQPTGEIIQYESCNMERSTMVQVVKSLYASLQAKGLTFCSVSAADELEKADIMNTLNFFSDAGIDQFYKKVNTRWTNTSQEEKKAEVYTHALNHGHSLWASNTGWLESSLEDMTQGLNLAHRIVQDLRNLIPSAWILWQAASTNVPVNTGLVEFLYAYANVQKIRYKSGYYAMMHFSKHIKKGYSIIHINDVNSTAAYEPQLRTLIIVSVNSGTAPLQKIFELGALASVGKIDAFRTSRVEPHVAIPPPEIRSNIVRRYFRTKSGQFEKNTLVSGKQLKVELLPRSITTFRIRNAGCRYNDVYISNGDFESLSPSPWYLMYGSRQDNGVNGNYVFRGYRSGYLDFTESKLSLMQNITLYFTPGTPFYISAWVATSGNGTKFGLLVDGHQGAEISIRPNVGYQLYGLSVTTQEWNTFVTVYLQSEKGNHTAQIDNVAIH